MSFHEVNTGCSAYPRGLPSCRPPLCVGVICPPALRSPSGVQAHPHSHHVCPRTHHIHHAHSTRTCVTSHVGTHSTQHTRSHPHRHFTPTSVHARRSQHTHSPCAHTLRHASSAGFCLRAFLAGSVLSCCCDRSPRLSSFSHTDLLVSHGSVGLSLPWASLAQIRVRASGLPPETPGRSCFLPFPASRGLPPSTVTAMVASLTSCCRSSVRPLPVHTRGPRAHVEPPQIAQGVFLSQGQLPSNL